MQVSGPETRYFFNWLDTSNASRLKAACLTGTKTNEDRTSGGANEEGRMSK
jgi:hypothetical protein